MQPTCLSCELIAGARDLPGGRIHSTQHWVVEHCVGPLGVGTLIVKPFRHCVHVGPLNRGEADELGPLLAQASACVQQLAGAEQVYVCLWSHGGWSPGHIHFVVQPSWAHLRERYASPGPTVQSEQLRANVVPPRPDVEAFSARARRWPGWAAA